MNKNKLNYFIDIGALISGTIVLATGILKLNIFRISPMALTPAHDWSGIIFAVFVLIHFMLHFKWIVATTKGYKSHFTSKIAKETVAGSSN
ncbi:MAG: DUF4405 domain-containing protein [Candidatus Nanoarchaeia archaeon]|nr:DUF4405 domain-containing protein [Candidatus Nanoarchaeia archaeon]